MAEPSSPLRTAFTNLPTADHPAQWDSFYRKDFHPWDRDGPSLALADLLLQRPDLVPPAQEDLDDNDSPATTTPYYNGYNTAASPTRQRCRRTALVPGCGKGHDALLLASFGYDVWGLDVSDKGLELARENERVAEEKGLYKAQDGVEKGSVRWVAGDFFDDEWTRGAGADESGRFDLIFDYTFLCALPPDLRPRWAERMSALITPKGRLVCLEFPSGKALREDGPPWGLNPEVYEALLSAPGEPIQYDESGDGSVVSLPSPKPRDNAIHRLSLIKPARTHPAGTNEDGSVKDFISVWSR